MSEISIICMALGWCRGPWFARAGRVCGRPSWAAGTRARAQGQDCGTHACGACVCMCGCVHVCMCGCALMCVLHRCSVLNKRLSLACVNVKC